MKDEIATGYTPINTKFHLFLNHSKSKTHKDAVALTKGLNLKELATMLRLQQANLKNSWTRLMRTRAMVMPVLSVLRSGRSAGR